MNPLLDQKDLIAGLDEGRERRRQFTRHVLSEVAELALIDGPRPISIGGFTNNFLGENHSCATNTPEGTERLLQRLAIHRLSPPSQTEFTAVAVRAISRGFLNSSYQEECGSPQQVFNRIISRGLYHRTKEIIGQAAELRHQRYLNSRAHEELFTDARAIAYFNTCLASSQSRSEGEVVGLALANIFDEIRFPQLKAEDFVLCGGTCITLHKAALRAISKPKDVMLLPAGSFDSLMELPAQCEAVPLIIPTHETGYKLSAKELAKMVLAIKPHLHRQQKISCLVLTNPTNPTGLAYSADELKAIGAVAIQAGIKVIVDEHFAGLDHVTQSQRAPIVSMGSLSVAVEGETHLLHDHCFTIQGSAKLLGTEDLKIGFGITGDSAWRSLARARITEEQLELTVLEEAFVSASLEERAPYSSESRRHITERFRTLSAGVRMANANAGGEIYSLVARPNNGLFACLGISTEVAKRFGIEDEVDFSFYVNATTGIFTRAIAGMGLETPGRVSTRINITQPTDRNLQATFDRLGVLGKRMYEGTAPMYNRKALWSSQSIEPVIESEPETQITVHGGELVMAGSY